MRKCTICGKPMDEGYCINEGEAYYCSDECLSHDYNPEQWNETYECGDGYWTRWDN